jgi:hypothetical protein
MRVLRYQSLDGGARLVLMLEPGALTPTWRWLVAPVGLDADELRRVHAARKAALRRFLRDYLDAPCATASEPWCTLGGYVVRQTPSIGAACSEGPAELTNQPHIERMKT